MLKILRRRGWILVFTIVAVPAAAFVSASARRPVYSAVAVAVVASSHLLTPDQANRLAVTDAVLIPKDTAIAKAVARSLNATPSDVPRRISVFNDPDTAILRIDYRGTTAANARAGAITLANSISGRHPSSPNIAPGSISIVRLPTTARSTQAPRTFLAIGVILGFILGAVLAIAWERADARIDGLEELSSELTCSTSYIDGLSNAAATALLERWRRLAGSQAKVALLPATVSLEQRLRDVALELALADETEKAVVASNTSGSDGRMRISEVGGAPRATNGDSVLVAGEVPGGESAGEGIALASDLTVLVVEQGTRRKDVRKALEALRQFAIEPAWALLISRGSARKVHMRVKSAPAHSRAAVKSADVV